MITCALERQPRKVQIYPHVLFDLNGDVFFCTITELFGDLNEEIGCTII